MWEQLHLAAGLAVAGVLLFQFAIFFRYAPRLGLGAVMAASVWASFGPPPAIGVAGFSVYPLDVFTVALLLSLLLRLPFRSPHSRQLTVLGALLAAAVLRGLAEFGSQQAINNARPFLYFIVVLAFVLVMLGPTAWDFLQRLWKYTGIVLAVAALVFVARNGFGTYAESGDRPLNSTQALIVAQAAVVVIGTSVRRRDAWLAVAMLGIVLVSQQRTVWVTTMLMISVLVFRSGAFGTLRTTRALRQSVAVALLLTIGLVVAGPTEFRASASEATSSVSTTSGTFGWRIEGWVDILDQYMERPTIDQVVGQPMGQGYSRQVGAGQVDVSPHNMYITVLVSFGALGLVTYVLLMWRAVRRSSQLVALQAIVAGLIVFGIGYQLGTTDGIVLGAALAMAARNTPVGVAVSAKRLSPEQRR